MKHCTVLGLFAVVLFGVAGCGAKPKDQIVGKWEAAEADPKKGGGMTVEFKKEGDVVMSVGAMNISGKYKFPQDDVVEIEIEKLGKKDAKKMKVDIKGDELTTTEVDGKKEVTKFKKAK